jgi:hypothetical protein
MELGVGEDGELGLEYGRAHGAPRQRRQAPPLLPGFCQGVPEKAELQLRVFSAGGEARRQRLRPLQANDAAATQARGQRPAPGQA